MVEGGNNFEGNLAWESSADPVSKAPHTPSPSPSMTLYRLTEQRAGELWAGAAVREEGNILSSLW